MDAIRTRTPNLLIKRQPISRCYSPVALDPFKHPLICGNVPYVGQLDFTTVHVSDFSLVVFRELNGTIEGNGMGRPPHPVGTSGGVRSYRSAAGWRSRKTVRDHDGATREISEPAAPRGKRNANWPSPSETAPTRPRGPPSPRTQNFRQSLSCGSRTCSIRTAARRRCRCTGTGSTDRCCQHWETSDYES
jgi:hypothetical protein